MPIYSLLAQNLFQCVGIVALGRSRKAENGNLYPEDLTFFNLERAEMLKPIYGEEPVEIDVMFVDDSIDKNIPHFLKMHAGGKIGPDGKRMGGKLLCKGTGPVQEVVDGELVESPGDAEHWAMRDPNTGVIPKRPCLGPQCPDFIAERCKPAMNVLFLAPLYSYQVGFRIHTTSWRSIKSFLGVLMRTQEITGGRLKDVPFKIVRKATTIQSYDVKQKKDVVRVKHIMYLEPNNDFFERHKLKSVLQRDLLERLAVSLKGVLLEANSQPLPALTGEIVEEYENEPMPDHWPALPESEAATLAAGPVIDVEEEKRRRAEDVLKDPEVDAAFAKLETATGKKFDTKNRLMAIRKKENMPELKAAVLDEMNRKLAELAPKTAPKAAAQPKIEPAAKASGGDIL